MNINQYKKSMDEITAKKIEMDELLKINSKKVNLIRQIKYISAFVLVCILVLNIIYFTGFNRYTFDNSIKVYAAEQKIELTKDFIKMDLDANLINGGSSSAYYFMNYNLNLKCEGNDINTITYICSDQNVNVNNRFSAKAYFVENMSVPEDEYLNKIKEKNYVYGYKAEGENIANITNLIGNSYTVNYDNQNDRQYGLVLAGTISKNGIYQLNNTIIKIDIVLKDGTIQHKKIIINSANGNSFSEIKLRLL